jgi:hypothetical protein
MIRALALALALAGCASTEYDMGGSVHEYSMKYHAMEQAGEMWVAPKDCGSACTLGLRNTRACYTPDAEFHFHGVSRRGEYDARASAAFRDAMPEGVRKWAEQTGAFNSTEVVSISGRDLAAYDGRVCS